jgi:hypothetical protein
MWSSLASPSQAAFRYAVGFIKSDGEPSPVSSASAGSDASEWRVSSSLLLAGIYCVDASPKRNPLHEILSYFNVSRVAFERSVREATKSDRTRSDPSSRLLVPLDDLPPMTTNARAAIDDAGEHEPRRADGLSLESLLGALLRSLASRSHSTLVIPLRGKVELVRLVEVYEKYLVEPERSLAKHFEDAGIERCYQFPGFARDGISGNGPDVLGREELVDQIARWLCARQLETPLAVGLFGDWGSGKSYFMERLRERIEQLRAESARAESPIGTAYCTRVRQVNFNAWAYADSELWPSLAAEVFRSVAGHPDAKSPKFTVAVDADVRLAQERLAAAEDSEKRGREQVVEAAEAVSKARAGIVEEAAKKASALGPGVSNAIASGQAVRDALTVRTLVRARWRSIKPGKRVGMVVAALLVCIAAVIFLLLAPSTIARLATIVGAVLALGSAASPVSAFVLKLLREDAQLQSREREFRDAQRAEQSAAEARAAALAELEALARRGTTEVYASDQADVWAGRERLGVVAEIRRSFERLSRLIDEDTRKDGSGHKKESSAMADRVIVYVDDLDRCEPAFVVRVLEAIKLLMDLNHFVVMVGVDSRWLIRSLQLRFGALIAEDGQSGPGYSAATPQNYLEKIFQVSLAVPTMRPEGYEALVRQLLPGAPDQTSESAQGYPEPSADPARLRDDVRSQVQAGDQPAPTGPSEDSVDEIVPDVSAAPLYLTEGELNAVLAVAGLIDTPRSAKRLTNVYRLMRVIVGEEELLADENYVAVISLLALLIGFPRESSEILRILNSADDQTPWGDFVHSLAPDRRNDSAPYYNAVLPEILTQDVAVWRRIGAPPTSHAAALPVARFKAWAGIVSGYTFHPWARADLRLSSQDA